MGVLPGFYQPHAVQVFVDDQPLDAQRIKQLRRHIAWVDPGIQLWNRSFLENLRYGAPSDTLLPIGKAIEQADLHNVVSGLPDGLQTVLGENGGFLSGGEGQRTRFGRGLLRRDARFVILDEPFRGLDRHKRHELLIRARKWWKDATLICITHDLAETTTFKRVLVIENGRIIEDDSPQQLMTQPDSRYKDLMDAENVVNKNQWDNMTWRKIRLARGVVTEINKTGENK